MITQPFYTQIPNEFIDVAMRQLSGSAFKVLMAIARKTFGFHKEDLRDRISNSQLMELTGISSKSTIYAAVDELGEYITKTTSGKGIFYQINIADNVRESFDNRTINNENGTKTVHTKETGVKHIKTIVANATPEKTDPLYHRVEQAFLSKNGGVFDNYGKEGKAIHWLVAKARGRNPEDPAGLLHAMLNAFWKLKTGDTKGFWRDEPFLPSSLSSRLARVLETMRNDEVDPELLAIVNGGAT